MKSKRKLLITGLFIMALTILNIGVTRNSVDINLSQNAYARSCTGCATCFENCDGNMSYCGLLESTTDPGKFVQCYFENQ